MKLSTINTVLAVTASAVAQSSYSNATQSILRQDNGTYGPELEEVHYYYDQWPIGLAVSSKGRIFVDYTRGNYSFTVGEVVNKTTEKPYPSLDLQVPPSALLNSSSGISFGTNNATAFISVQALIITAATSSRNETLWVVDTGRPATSTGGNAYGVPGGPKIVAIDLNTDTINRTYTFPETVHYIDSYMNDIRIDLSPNATTSGAGIAYIVDSSNEGRNGFIMLDLGTGASWRALTQHPSTLTERGAVDTNFGIPNYITPPGAAQFGHQAEGIDGVQLSPDGSTIYYSPLTANALYSIDTRYLRDHTSPDSAQRASDNVRWLGQRGGAANGFEGDSNGLVYQLVPSQNAIFAYDPAVGKTGPFVRDPRILWPDSASVGEDGYIYVNINQLPFQPAWNNGTDGRVHPGAILRAKLPNGGSKIKSG